MVIYIRMYIIISRYIAKNCIEHALHLYSCSQLYNIISNYIFLLYIGIGIAIARKYASKPLGLEA